MDRFACAIAIPEQSGLKLVPAKAPIEMFVIESVERASSN